MRSDAATSSRVDFLACRIVTPAATSAAVNPIATNVMSSWARTERPYHSPRAARASTDAAVIAPFPGASPPGATVSSGRAEEENTAVIVLHHASGSPMRTSVVDRGGLFERVGRGLQPGPARSRMASCYV